MLFLTIGGLVVVLVLLAVSRLLQAPISAAQVRDLGLTKHEPREPPATAPAARTANDPR